MTEAQTAITYSRVSTDERSRAGYSLPDQREGTRRWCEAEGYEILEEIADPGHSGAYLERPGLDRLRDLVQGGGVSVVVVQDRDRLAREPAYVYLLKKEFEEHGTRVVALNAHGDGSPEGELTDGMLDQLAKYERAKMAERTRRGLDRKVAEGKLIRGNKAPYGFAYDERGEALTSSEPEMGVVRRIFRMIGAEGLSMGEVERRLNREGVPSPTGGKWRRQSVRYLVLNELYRPHSRDEVAASGLVRPEVARALDEEGVYGLWVWNRMQVRRWRERAADGGYRDRVKNVERPREAWAAVPVHLSDAGLAPQLVEAARERLAENKPRPPANTRRFWQLSGGIARCGVCGNGFSTHHVYEPSKIRFYYRCYKRYNYGLDECSNNRHMPADVIEEAVWQAVLNVLSDSERLRRQYEEHVERKRRQMRGDPDREARLLAKRLAELTEERKNYHRLAARGSMSDDELDAALAEVESRRKELAEELERARGRQRSVKELEGIWLMMRHLAAEVHRLRLDLCSLEDRRRLYQALHLQATVDRDGTVRLTGVFPEIYLLDFLKDPPDEVWEQNPDVPCLWRRRPVNPVRDLPDDTGVVVTLTSAAPCNT